MPSTSVSTQLTPRKRARSAVQMIPVYGPHTSPTAGPDFFLPRTVINQYITAGYLRSVNRGKACRLTNKVRPPQLRGASCKLSLRTVEALIMGSERARELLDGWEVQHHALVGVVSNSADGSRKVHAVPVVNMTPEELAAAPTFDVCTPMDVSLYEAQL